MATMPIPSDRACSSRAGLSAGAWDAVGHDHTMGGSDTVMWIKGRHNIKLGSFVMWGNYAENGASAGGGQIDEMAILAATPWPTS